MKVLILGGTRFLGPHLAKRLVASGHDVTVLHRGRTLPSGVAGTTSIVGERDESLDSAGSDYDAIVDTSGYLPASVRKSVAYFARVAPDATYAFVSSISAYRDGLPPSSDERAPRWDGGDLNATEVTPETYGPLKARCEDAVTDAYGDASLIVRPGLIVGPLDPTDRFTYWVRRMSQGGDVVAPGDPRRYVQFVDARDLADWIVTALERHVAGAFNATGPQPPLTFEAFLRACAAVSTTPSTLHWVSDERLLRAGIVPWSGLPLWIPQAEADGWNSISSAKARAAGFRNRPVEETIADTREWDRNRHRDGLSCGLSREMERRLLAEANEMTTPPTVKIGGIDLSGYMVKDAPRAIVFYREVLGLEPVLVYPDDRGAEYELPDGTTFGLWGGGGRVMPFQPSNGILFAVEDLDAAVASLKARGIEVVMQNETAVCRMAMIHDTEGNLVTLHQRK